jgi:hypothetical protein
VPQQYNGVANFLLLGMVFGMPAVFWLCERFVL